MDQLFDFIKDYGGYAGAASVLGLAVLSLLYFAQAREVKRLREWAGRAPERDAELQARVTAEAARRTTAPAAPAAARPVPARQPGAPQTAAAQAAARPANGQVAGLPAGAIAGGMAATAAMAAAQQPVEAAATTAAPPTTPSPTAPAAGAVPTPAQQETTADIPPVPPRTPAARPRPTAAPRTAGASALRTGGAGSGGRSSRPATVQTQRAPRRFPVVPAAIAAGVVALGVVLVIVLTGGGDDPQNTSTPQPTGTVRAAPGTTTPKTTAEAQPRAETTVAVLNGTTIGGLAARTADKVTGAGYKKGTVADAADQNRSATIVQYAEGQQAAARQVARVIGVGNDAVSKLDVNTKTVAGDADVVVTVGSDQNAQSGQTG